MIIETPSGRLNVVVDGPAHAPAILFSNALGTALDLWSAQAAALRDRFKVIRYDTRGHGGSSSPEGEYTIDHLGGDVIHILDALRIERAHVCGISLGGLTGQWLALRHPERLRSLVLADTSARVGTRERWLERAEKARVEGMAAIARLVLPGWFTEEFRTREPQTVERFRQMVESCDVPGYVGCCAAVRDADFSDVVHTITTRTLVIGGQYDPTTTMADAEFLHGAIPGSGLATLPGAHLTNVECAAAFSHQIAVFATAVDG